MPTRRTQYVWISFVAAMTLVIAALNLSDPDAPGGLVVATNVDLLGTSGTTEAPSSMDQVFETEAPIEPDRWTGIVIHHLGSAAGDPDSIHRLHLSYGYQGLGYHFIIGNGNGMDDGVLHAGYRWIQQLPGAHVAGPAGEVHNDRSIGICLVGHGDRREFTAPQIAQLVRVVRRLQRDLDIPGHRVVLHRDLFDGTTDPGRFFPAATFREQLRD